MKRLAKLVRKGPDGPVTRAEFVRLYEEHLPAVFNYCLFQVGEHHQAEDMTADIFERAWMNRQQYDPAQAAFTTWLFAIARNRTIDSYRRRARQPIQPLSDYEPDGRPWPEDQAALAEQQSYLQQQLQILPQEQQELIALKFGAGLTNRHIAALLNKQESAVGSALHRIMKKLRQQMAEIESVNE